MHPCLAVDIGGTKLAAAVVADDGARRSTPVRRPPPTTTGEQVFAALIAALVDAVLAALGDRRAGAACAASGAAARWRRAARRCRRSTSRRGAPSRCGPASPSAVGLPVHVDNDAKALALGEGWLGAAAGAATTTWPWSCRPGSAAGIVLDGRLLDGRRGNAGHIGHVIVEPDGRPCRVRRPGLPRGRGVRHGHRRHHRVDPAAEADAATSSGPGRLVGRAVGSVAVLLDLRLAVVAGSVALGFGEPFFAAAQAEIDRRGPARLRRAAARIAPAGLGAAGPLVGAAAVGLLHRRGASGPAQ